MNNSLKYVTYQTFPAKTANSLQTISNIKYLIKNNVNVELYFPIREKQSSDNLEQLQTEYEFSEGIILHGLKHNYLHGKVKFFKSFWYNLSHILWSRKTVQKHFKSNISDVFFTRSDWIAYFLAKQGSKVVFEVHQVSKIRNFVLKQIKNLKNVKIIFLNQELSSFYLHPNNSLVLHNGVDNSLYSNSAVKKLDNHIIYLGKLSRFNQPRGINNIINWFKDKEINETYTLEIVGGNKKEVKQLNELIEKLNLSSVVTIHSWVGRKEAIKKLEESSIGLLVNSNTNSHSKFYTSPLKYFEYIYAKLKIVAVDFPSHRALPLADHISFFNENDKESFINSLNNLRDIEEISKNDLSSITLDSRAKKLIDFIF
jgi:glycosyltransferase involved in cell wall biosynthesis